jgi:hypothetical protein
MSFILCPWNWRWGVYPVSHDDDGSPWGEWVCFGPIEVWRNE